MILQFQLGTTEIVVMDMQIKITPLDETVGSELEEENRPDLNRTKSMGKHYYLSCRIF